MDKEERKAYSNAYRLSHPEQVKAYSKAYRDAHRTEAKAYRDSHKEESRVYKAANQGAYKAAQLKRRHGITLEQYNAMLEAQDNRCAGCNSVFDLSNKGSTPCVDHCHNTGKIRGILCGNCNKGIGLLKDNIQTLNNLINYLERSHK